LSSIAHSKIIIDIVIQKINPKLKGIKTHLTKIRPAENPIKNKILSAQVDLRYYFKISCFKGFWISMELPYICYKHLNYYSNIITNIQYKFYQLRYFLFFFSISTVDFHISCAYPHPTKWNRFRYFQLCVLHTHFHFYLLVR
jgi:hypothetical protein